MFFFHLFPKEDTSKTNNEQSLHACPFSTTWAAFLGGSGGGGGGGGPPPIEHSSYKDETAASARRDAVEVWEWVSRNIQSKATEKHTHTCILRERVRSGGTGAQGRNEEEGEKESERTERSITAAWSRFLQQLSALRLSRHAQLCRHLEDEEQWEFWWTSESPG